MFLIKAKVSVREMFLEAYNFGEFEVNTNLKYKFYYLHYYHAFKEQKIHQNTRILYKIQMYMYNLVVNEWNCVFSGYFGSMISLASG